MKKPLYIYGAGGLGREVLSLVRCLEEWEVLAFFDDHVAQGTLIKNIPVLGGIKAIESLKEKIYIVLAIGDPHTKAALAQKLQSYLIEYPSLVHPSVVLQDKSSIHIGQGCIIAANSILTTDIQLGDHVLINLNCTVGHDTSIGNCTSVMPGVNVAGEVTLGESVLVGSGANILNRVRIGDRSRVGMGSVVIRNVESGSTVVGVPAKLIP